MLEFCIFEISYRLKHVSTYVFALILVSIAVLTQIAQGGGFFAISISSSETMFINSPRQIYFFMGSLFMTSLFLMATFIHQMFSKDFESKFYGLLFTKPITKAQYIFGRLLGNIAIMLGIYIVSLLAFHFAVYLPNIDKELVTQAKFLWYLEPFFTILIPNLLFVSALFIAVVIATKKTASVFGMGFLIYAVREYASYLGRKIENDTLSTLIDPFGARAFSLSIRGWTPVELNTQMIGFPQYLIYNRIIWVTVAIIVLFIAWKIFSPHVRRSKIIDTLPPQSNSPLPPSEQLPPTPLREGGNVTTPKFVSLLNFNLDRIFRSVSFYFISFVSIFFMVYSAIFSGMIFGTSILPVTNIIAGDLSSDFSGVFMMLIITFLTGELIWASRNSRFSEIEDTLPVSNFISFFSKYSAIAIFVAIFTAIMIIVGVVFQTIKGYYNYEFDVYFKILFFSDFPKYLIYILIAFFIHNFINQKYFAHFVFMLFLIFKNMLSIIRIEHPLIVPFRIPELVYSNMSGFGNNVPYFFWMTLYWGLIAVLMTSFTVICYKRGLQQNYFKNYIRTLKTKTAQRFNFVVITLILITAGYIFYNTNIINTYYSTKKMEKLRIAYELEYKHFEMQNQPKIQDIKMNVDLYPEKKKMYASGTYVIANKGDTVIDTLFIHYNDSYNLHKIKLSHHAPTLNCSGETPALPIMDSDKGVILHPICCGLAPEETLIFDFEVSNITRGFYGKSNEIMRNGSLIYSSNFPSFGYNNRMELSHVKRRRKLNLPERENRMLDTDDSWGLSQNYVSSDGDWLSFEVTLSTAEDQIVLAPGELLNDEFKPSNHPEYSSGLRRFMTYSIPENMLNFYTFLSARYEVKRDKWQDVELEIYYHPGHTFNLAHMLQGLKDSLEYYSNSFGPYYYNILRIAEFPRYGEYAQAFPTLIPFSEGIGFIANVKSGDINYPYYITAHETAHQWWAHQLIGGKTRGAVMLSETLTEYSSLMVVQHKFDSSLIRKQLQYTLMSYMMGRSHEARVELPLTKVETQQYLFYNKGMLVMNAVSRLLGEDVLNKALAEFLDEYKFTENPYPNTNDFMRVLNPHVPDSLKVVIDEMFNQVVVNDLRTVSQVVEELEDGKYKTTVTFRTEKRYFDDEGNPENKEWSGWLEIALSEDSIFFMSDSIFHIEKVWVDGTINTAEFITDIRPGEVILDPYFMTLPVEVFFARAKVTGERTRGLDSSEHTHTRTVIIGM